MGVLCVVVVVGVLLIALLSGAGRSAAAAGGVNGDAAPREPMADAKVVALPRGARVDVVGESHYQRALESIAGGRTEESRRIAATATLIREPKNRHDANAVAVHIEGKQVGYLARADALLFKGLLDDMAKRGESATCAALIVGGWNRGSRGKGSFGVQLNLVHPDKAPPEASIISKAITDLWAAKGPAGRRTVLRNALASLRTDEAKMQMLNEVSSVEVVAVLEAASALKTKAAKKRRLEDALVALKADEVPDELQQEQVKWLEDALRELDAPAEGKMTS